MSCNKKIDFSTQNQILVIFSLLSNLQKLVRNDGKSRTTFVIFWSKNAKILC